MAELGCCAHNKITAARRDRPRGASIIVDEQNRNLLSASRRHSATVRRTAHVSLAFLGVRICMLILFPNWIYTVIPQCLLDDEQRLFPCTCRRPAQASRQRRIDALDIQPLRLAWATSAR